MAVRTRRVRGGELVRAGSRSSALAGGRAQEAFDLTREPAKIVERYGEHDWCRQALLARRLVERGGRGVAVGGRRRVD